MTRHEDAPVWIPRLAFAIALGAVACAGNEVAGQKQARARDETDAGLKPVAAFAGIPDAKLRSAALFQEAGRVVLSPRCLNCHPVERMPTQGDDLHPHDPFVEAGSTDHGVPGLPCQACHGSANVKTLSAPIQTIPGDPAWALAPASMAWQGKTLGEICVQLKDPARNGGRSLDAIHEHMAKDSLVGWAWHPGDGRRPAPGTQESLGQLIQAWIDTGAVCPDSR
jgi:hypothetical protein